MSSCLEVGSAPRAFFHHENFLGIHLTCGKSWTSREKASERASIALELDWAGRTKRKLCIGKVALAIGMHAKAIDVLCGIVKESRP